MSDYEYESFRHPLFDSPAGFFTNYLQGSLDPRVRNHVARFISNNIDPNNLSGTIEIREKPTNGLSSVFGRDLTEPVVIIITLSGARTQLPPIGFQYGITSIDSCLPLVDGALTPIDNFAALKARWSALSSKPLFVAQISRSLTASGAGGATTFAALTDVNVVPVPDESLHYDAVQSKWVQVPEIKVNAANRTLDLTTSNKLNVIGDSTVQVKSTTGDVQVVAETGNLGLTAAVAAGVNAPVFQVQDQITNPNATLNVVSSLIGEDIQASTSYVVPTVTSLTTKQWVTDYVNGDTVAVGLKNTYDTVILTQPALTPVNDPPGSGQFCFFDSFNARTLTIDDLNGSLLISKLDINEQFFSKISFTGATQILRFRRQGQSGSPQADSVVDIVLLDAPTDIGGDVFAWGGGQFSIAGQIGALVVGDRYSMTIADPDPIKDNLTASADPTPTDDETQGYSNGSRWYNLTASGVRLFVCTKALAGGAIWASHGESSDGVNYAVGRGASASNTSVAIGPNSTASGLEGVVIGAASFCTNDLGVLVGAGSSIASNDNIVIGRGTNMSIGEQTVLIGHGLSSTFDSSVQIGTGSSCTAANTVAVGVSSVATATRPLGLGFAGSLAVLDTTTYTTTANALKVNLNGVTDVDVAVAKVLGEDIYPVGYGSCFWSGNAVAENGGTPLNVGVDWKLGAVATAEVTPSKAFLHTSPNALGYLGGSGLGTNAKLCEISYSVASFPGNNDRAFLVFVKRTGVDIPQSFTVNVSKDNVGGADGCSKTFLVENVQAGIDEFEVYVRNVSAGATALTVRDFYLQIRVII